MHNGFVFHDNGEPEGSKGRFTGTSRDESLGSVLCPNDINEEFKPEESVFRVKQVAKRFSLSVSKIYEMVESGELPHHRFGGAIRVSEEQIVEYMNRTKKERRSAAPAKVASPRPRLKHIKL